MIEMPSIAAVRALVREEASSLLDDATDAQIDAAIKQNINRPVATLHMLAGSAIVSLEFQVLADKLRQAVSDGSVLDYEPSDARSMRSFRKVRAPKCELPALAKAHEVAANQPFLASHLLTAASEILLDAGAEFDPHDRALAVRIALFTIAGALIYAVSQCVVDAMPAKEWEALLAARNACWEENERYRVHAAAAR
jgi:hypothetical protein